MKWNVPPHIFIPFWKFAICRATMKVFVSAVETFEGIFRLAKFAEIWTWVQFDCASANLKEYFHK